MAKVSLKATGGLNKDVDLNLLPEGDYSDATNIIFDSGKTGGAGAIKMLESILSANINFTGHTIKDTHQAADGQIYVLTTNGATAYIYRIPTSLDSAQQILNYPHEVGTDFAPDIKVLDNCIIWNYHGNGTPLLFSLDGWTTPVYYTSVSNLTLVKRTPNNVFTVNKTVGTAEAGLEFLETNDFQFCGRYHYKTGEYSAMSAYSQMYKAEIGVTDYAFTYSFSGAPANAEYFELYTRIGNAGIWRRIDTAKIETDTSFSWTGQIYESLDTVTTSKPFDAVPISAKHIEIAKNRVFLANIVDDYSVSSANLDFTISSGNGYTPATGGTYGSYLHSSDLFTEASLSSKESTSVAYYKPFANSSTYGIGLAYYDEAMKTRGVEKYVKFNTGKFAYPILPTITIGLGSSWVKPAWAKYAQLVYTKNISKSYIYEGYASNIFFELTTLTTLPTTKAVTEITTITQSLTEKQVKNVKFLVVDLMGMFRAGNIYNFSEDDRISINTPNGLLDLKIESQKDNFLYCKYDKGIMTNPVIPVAKSLYFEIYTPKQVPEDESLLFYEYGNLMEINSSWTASSNISISGAGTLGTNKLLGDMVFSKIDLPVYSTAPFIYTKYKSNPKEYLQDVLTTVNTANFSMQSSASGPTNSLTDATNTLTFNSITANGDIDAAIITGTGAPGTSGDQLRVSGFYDAGDQESGTNQISIDYKIKKTWTLYYPEGSSIWMDWEFSSQVYRIPYNNATNEYGTAVTFGTVFMIDKNSATALASNTSVDFVTTQVIPLNSAADIAADDKFYVELKLHLVVNGNPGSTGQALINFANQDGQVGAVFKLNGDRITPVIETTYNPYAIISGTKAKLVRRASSTATARQFWNTSAGKPLVLVLKNLNTTSRTNTIRYGGNYVAGTKINNLSSFFALDSADVPIENGPIVSLQRASRLQGNGTMLLALCQNESAYILLGEQELTQGNNQGILSISSNVIGTIRNLGYNYGLQDKQSSFNYKGNVWWWDNYNKKVIKYNEQGIELVSDNFMRSYFLTKSGTAKFAFDPFYNMCFVSIGSDSYSTGYSDTLKRWISTYDFKPDHAESYGDKMVLFKNSVVYKSLQSGYNAFLGVTAENAPDSTITFTLNSRLPIMPLNVSVSHDMNVVDYTQSNGVKASLLSIAINNENGQASAINETNFIAEDNRLYAHILRDSNSPRGLIEGNYIIGYLNNFVVSLKDKTQNMRLNSLDIEIQSVSGHS